MKGTYGRLAPGIPPASGACRRILGEVRSVFTQHQLASILSSLPDPAFILTRSGRYAAIFGGKDTRHYHDGSSLVGRNMFEVLKAEKDKTGARRLDSLRTETVEVGRRDPLIATWIVTERSVEAHNERQRRYSSYGF